MTSNADEEPVAASSGAVRGRLPRKKDHASWEFKFEFAFIIHNPHHAEEKISTSKPADCLSISPF